MDNGAKIGSGVIHFLSQSMSGISKAVALVSLNKYADVEKLFFDYVVTSEKRTGVLVEKVEALSLMMLLPP